MQVTMKPLKSGDPGKCGDLTLRGRLSEGGMGTVHYGVTLDVDRVTVKTTRHDLTTNEEAKDRFEREILFSGMAVSPRIAALLAASKPDETPPRLAAEYVLGLTLTEYVQEPGPLALNTAAALFMVFFEYVTAEVQPLPVGWAAAIGTQVCTVLAAAHRLGLVHRDLKPTAR